jgi:AcrR family transcriptional regulator
VDADSTESVPAGIAAAWGVRDQPRKGPRPALTLPRIVAAAIKVADTEGLDAVSMSRVAAEAGTAPMSLYRHVSAKDELIEHMLDTAWGPPPDRVAEDWRAGLTRWAWGMRTAFQLHPWAVRIPLKSLPIMPNAVAWFENALAAMEETGLSEPRKASVIMLLSGFTRNLASTEADIGAAMQASGLPPDQWMSYYSQLLRKLTDPQRFPALTTFIDSGVFEAADGPDDEFIFGLDRILDGIATLIETELIETER